MDMGVSRHVKRKKTPKETLEITAYKKNFRYFHRKYEELVHEYPDHHVAICNGKYLDSDEVLSTLLERLEGKVDVNTCLIGHVSDSNEDLLL